MVDDYFDGDFENDFSVPDFSEDDREIARRRQELEQQQPKVDTRKVVAEAKQKFTRKNVPITVRIGGEKVKFASFRQFYNFTRAMMFTPKNEDGSDDFSLAQDILSRGFDDKGQPKPYDEKENPYETTGADIFELYKRHGQKYPDLNGEKWKSVASTVRKQGLYAASASMRQKQEEYLMQHGVDPQELRMAEKKRRNFEYRHKNDGEEMEDVVVAPQDDNVYRVCAIGHRPGEVYSNLKQLDDRYEKMLSSKNDQELSTWMKNNPAMATYMNNLVKSGYTEHPMNPKMRYLISTKKEQDGDYQSDRFGHMEQMYFQSMVQKAIEKHPKGPIEFHTGLTPGTEQIFARAVIAEKAKLPKNDRDRVKLVADWLGPAQFKLQKPKTQDHTLLLLGQCDEANLYRVAKDRRVSVKKQGKDDLDKMMKNWDELSQESLSGYAYIAKAKGMVGQADEVNAVYDRKFAKKAQDGHVRHSGTGRGLAYALTGNVSTEPKPVDNTYANRNTYEVKTGKEVNVIDPLAIATEAIQSGAAPIRYGSPKNVYEPIRKQEMSNFWNKPIVNGQRLKSTYVITDNPNFQKSFFKSIGHEDALSSQQKDGKKKQNDLSK